jgi:hypothetical protein
MFGAKNEGMLTSRGYGAGDLLPMAFVEVGAGTKVKDLG